MSRLIMILAACGFAAPDSLAWVNFRADSTRAQVIAWKGDSIATALRFRAQVVMDEAYFRLQRDTAKVVR